MNSKSTVRAICILIIFTACATTPKAHNVDPQLLSSSNLSFIKDGVTTRVEVLTRLEKPSAQYENDRILTYRLRFDPYDNEFFSIYVHHYAYWGDPDVYSLVLVFDPGGKLLKHSLIGFKVVK